MSNRFEDKLVGAALKHFPNNFRRERITKPLTLKQFGLRGLLRKFTLLKFDMALLNLILAFKYGEIIKILTCGI